MREGRPQILSDLAALDRVSLHEWQQRQMELRLELLLEWGAKVVLRLSAISLRWIGSVNAAALKGYSIT